MRKTMFRWLVALAIVVPCMVFSASAATEGYYTYEVSNGEATITDVNTSISGDITIPSTLGGCPVTSIGVGAFAYCSSLNDVTIPGSVTSIEGGTFGFCSSLTGVTIPNSVTSIGNSAFYYCTSLTSVTIPDSVTSIGKEAFFRCSSLTSVTIGNSVTSIGNSAFEDCYSLTSVTIPYGMTSIEDDAFYYCESLTDVYYKGDKVGWQVISIGSGNEQLTGATRHYLLAQSVGEVSHGTVTLSAEFGKVGETIVVTAIAEEGYVLKAIYVGGVAIEGNSYTITGNHVVTAVFEKKAQERKELRGYFSLTVVNTIVVDGQEVQICRWVWTPFEG